MEIMVINSNGRVMMTSTGFNPDESQAMPDFEEALIKMLSEKGWEKDVLKNSFFYTIGKSSFPII